MSTNQPLSDTANQPLPDTASVRLRQAREELAMDKLRLNVTDEDLDQSVISSSFPAKEGPRIEAPVSSADTETLELQHFDSSIGPSPQRVSAQAERGDERQTPSGIGAEGAGSDYTDYQSFAGSNGGNKPPRKKWFGRSRKWWGYALLLLIVLVGGWYIFFSDTDSAGEPRTAHADSVQRASEYREELQALEVQRKKDSAARAEKQQQLQQQAKRSNSVGLLGKVSYGDYFWIPYACIVLALFLLVLFRNGKKPQEMSKAQYDRMMGKMTFAWILFGFGVILLIFGHATLRFAKVQRIPYYDGEEYLQYVRDSVRLATERDVVMVPDTTAIRQLKELNAALQQNLDLKDSLIRRQHIEFAEKERLMDSVRNASGAPAYRPLTRGDSLAIAKVFLPKETKDQQPKQESKKSKKVADADKKKGRPDLKVKEGNSVVDRHLRQKY